MTFGRVKFQWGAMATVHTLLHAVSRFGLSPLPGNSIEHFVVSKPSGLEELLFEAEDVEIVDVEALSEHQWNELRHFDRRVSGQVRLLC